jgi:hypothetical protein
LLSQTNRSEIWLIFICSAIDTTGSSADPLKLILVNCFWWFVVLFYSIFDDTIFSQVIFYLIWTKLNHKNVHSGARWQGFKIFSKFPGRNVVAVDKFISFAVNSFNAMVIANWLLNGLQNFFVLEVQELNKNL